ncbi:hypothetical protein H7H37_03300, partial [Mycolicibacterium insubricum]|nr:hypothetical protein [Mycolicibacterium insubricum]
IDLVRVNSRLTMFGLIGGTIVGGGIAAAIEYVCTTLFELPGAQLVVRAVGYRGRRSRACRSTSARGSSPTSTAG